MPSDPHEKREAFVPFTVFRPVWLGFPFFPWVLMILQEYARVSWTAPFGTIPWFLLTLYFHPVHLAVKQLGGDVSGMLWVLVSLAYCGCLALMIDSLVGELQGFPRSNLLIRRRTATRVLWGAIVVAVAYLPWRYAIYRDWPPISSSLPRHAFSPAQRHTFSRIRTYKMMGGFLNHTYLIRFEAAPEAMEWLTVDMDLEHLSRDRSQQAFWDMPPYWWEPEEASGGRFLKSPRFNPTGPSPDGDHFLFFWDPSRGVGYALIASNF